MKLMINRAMPDLSGLVLDATQHESILQPEGDFWLFAYGSLMWNPEFSFLRSETARLHGYHRRLCLWSVEHRGTFEHPGLVMGLDRGGSCHGQAFLIAEADAPNIIDRLNHREMITGAYRSAIKTLRLGCGEQVSGVCLIARRNHPQYAANLDHQTTIECVRAAQGGRGSNREYVLNTTRSLQQMGMRDSRLEAIAADLAPG